MELKDSQTALNLMRAFAGESQARNRYTQAAGIARSQNLHVLEAIFTMTADQERAHAWVFYQHLKPLTGTHLLVDGSYPVDTYESVLDLLKVASHNENEEYESIYPAFGKIAREEGFVQIANDFLQIARIEKIHHKRFLRLADLMENGQLFVSDVQTGWMCLNCGHVVEGFQAPKACPVCLHPQGYFIRLELAPYTCHHMLES